jgi:hypothetical protein
MAMKLEIKDNKLFIEIGLETPTPSSSGKTLVNNPFTKRTSLFPHLS